MIRLRRGIVTALGDSRRGVIDLLVSVEGGSAPALAFLDLTGPIAVGDTVLLNTSAIALGLGTGGMHLVVSVDGGPDTELERGRVVKARYTPPQTVVECVEETHRDVLDASPGLAGTPVVVAPLHSMIAPIAAGARIAGAERLAYVMTDGAALPGALSRLVPTLSSAGLLDSFVTTGQSFGGDLEATTIWTGLLAARELVQADVIVVADGPGNIGTDTRWGSGALNAGHSLNAVEALGGRPVAALRISFADPRARHRGVSHHSITILRDVCRVQADVAVPTLEEPERHDVWTALRAAELERRHRLVEVLGQPAVQALEEAGVDVTSMGRHVADDPPFFLAAGGAGILAGRMAARSKAWQRGSPERHADPS